MSDAVLAHTQAMMNSSLGGGIFPDVLLQATAREGDAQ
jgi:hypothetical protein